jgi:DNA-binding NarL/FixJ family response regulator
MAGWKVRIAVVDDHPLFRKGLALTLGGEPDFEVVIEVGSGEELSKLAGHIDFDVAVIDVMMPHGSGLTLAHELRDSAPGCRILALSAIDEPCLIADMLRAGAYGYALKSQPISEIVDAVRQVASGMRYLPATVARDAIDAELVSAKPPLVSRLTKREREIFELLIRGFSNSDIASRLFIALRTVETHRQRIMKKLSARTVAEIQRVAAQHGGLPL